MKTRHVLFSAILAGTVMLLGGCLRDPEIPTLDGPYIQVYYDGAVECELKYFEDVGPALCFLAAGNDEEELLSYSSGSTGEKKDFYDSLCNKHFDYGFHGQDPYYNEPLKKCYAKDIVSISVVSDSAYDKDHPAGASLDDIVVYDSYSTYKWIKGGYQGEPTFTRTRKFLKDLEPDDMVLLGAINIFNLYFYSFPTLQSSHKITVTIVTDNGTTYEMERDVFF